MRPNVHILIADDDRGHARLLKKNLERSGISNAIAHFDDGQEVLDFLYGQGAGPLAPRPLLGDGCSYILLLDIRMPRLDGFEVLRRIKSHRELKKIPVVVLSTTDDPRDIERCYAFGCSTYIIKPIEYEKFVETIKRLVLFLNVIEVPVIRNTGTAISDAVIADEGMEYD